MQDTLNQQYLFFDFLRLRRVVLKNVTLSAQLLTSQFISQPKRTACNSVHRNTNQRKSSCITFVANKNAGQRDSSRGRCQKLERAILIISLATYSQDDAPFAMQGSHLFSNAFNSERYYLHAGVINPCFLQSAAAWTTFTFGARMSRRSQSSRSQNENLKILRKLTAAAAATSAFSAEHTAKSVCMHGSNISPALSNHLPPPPTLTR